MTFNRVDYQQLANDYKIVEKAIRYVGEHYLSQPELSEIAAHVGLSEYHFQRLFSRWAGISPKRFLQYLTKENAKALLETSKDLLEVTYEVGLSSPSRLHDLFVTCEAVTPGEYKKRGKGLAIKYGVHPSPFGGCFLAATDRGICFIAFIQDDDFQNAFQELKDRWLEASLVEDKEYTKRLVEDIFVPVEDRSGTPLRLFLQGTNFQIKVWEALLKIPTGRVVSYQDVAVAIGMPEAPRAVGSAIGQNPLPVIVPCHRVIRKGGETGNYRYGWARKKALLAREAALSERQVRAHYVEHA